MRVVVSRMTIGAFSFSDAPMSVDGGSFDSATSRPGNRATSDEPGEKPSLRLISVGSMWRPSAFAGIDASAMFSRRPVSVSSSPSV